MVITVVIVDSDFEAKNDKRVGEKSKKKKEKLSYKDLVTKQNESESEDES